MLMAICFLQFSNHLEMAALFQYKISCSKKKKKPLFSNLSLRIYYPPVSAHVSRIFTAAKCYLLIHRRAVKVCVMMTCSSESRDHVCNLHFLAQKNGLLDLN